MSATATPEQEATTATRPRAVVLRATADTLPGATLEVAGLTAAERAIRQWARVPGTQVTVVSDGSVPLPPPPGGNVSVQEAWSREEQPEQVGAAPEDVLPANLV